MRKLIITTMALFVSSLIYATDVVVYPRLTGYPYPTPVSKTGQIISYATEDDGWNSTNRGVAWPIPRFTVQANTNCVMDNLTGLMWARDANIFGQTNWVGAVANCAGLNYGDFTDWRLPNLYEMQSIVAPNNNAPSLPTGHPFNNVEYNFYWTSTNRGGSGDFPFWQNFFWGQSAQQDKNNTTGYVWPVRGGY